MPEGQQDHGRVPVPVSIGLGGFAQGLDLTRRQVFSGAKLGVWAPGRRNRSIYCGWWLALWKLVWAGALCEMANET